MRVRDGIHRVAATAQEDENCEPLWSWVHNREFHDHPFWSGAKSSDTDEDRQDWIDDPGVQRLWNRDVFDPLTVPLVHTRLDKKLFQGGHLSDAGWAVLSAYRDASWRRLGSAEDTVNRLMRLCTAAKEQGVVIFTIGFEIDAIGAATGQERARRLMSQYATDETHYFDVDGLQMGEAFHLIASQIGKLRLTH